MQVCVKLSDGAACTTTISQQMSRLTEEEFEQAKVGLFFMFEEEFAELRKNIEEQCLRNRNCRESRQREQGRQFFNTMEAMSGE